MKTSSFIHRVAESGRQTIRVGVVLAAAIVATRLLAQTPPEAGSKPQPDAASASRAATPPAFMRVSEVKDQSIELQIGVRDYQRADGSGPRVGLVGVAHIGEREFYRELQKLLSEYEVVLYESVKPAGAVRPGGETSQERIDSTLESMKFVRGLIESHRETTKALPADLAQLKRFASEHDPRLAHFVEDATVDAWGNPLKFGLVADSAEPLDGYRLISFGADGAPGGEGEQADITLGYESQAKATALSDEDGLQSQLADALKLEFQLEAMDYDQPNWRCSDMDVGQLNRSLSERGLDFEVLGGTLAGSSLPAQLIKVLLGFMKLADSFMEGAITDTFKVVMIELLGDPSLTDMSMQQLGEGFAEVIINERNAVTINDLERVIQDEPDVESVAIFYGAGHMADFDSRLREMGYEPVEGGDRWITGMKVDLTKSAVSARELGQIRMMIKRTLRQQMGARRGK